MLVKLKTPLLGNTALLGIDAVPVEVEVDCADIGMPKTILVGLPEAAVKESTYRIGCPHFGGTSKTPATSIRSIVLPEIGQSNLAPADLPKHICNRGSWILHTFSKALWFFVSFVLIYTGCNKEKIPSQKGRFENEIRHYELLNKNAPPTSENTLFIGSSNFALWGSDLEKQFVQFNAVNRAFGGAHTTDLLSALDRLVLPYKPNRIVVFIGGNDIAYGANPENVFENLKRILEKIWTANPKTEVFFVSPTHAPSREVHWTKMDSFDQKVFDLSQKLDGLYHIDITNPMNDAQGNLRKDLYRDGLHLNEVGRKLWVHLISSAIEVSQKNPIVKTDEQLRQQREELGIFRRNTVAESE